MFRSISVISLLILAAPALADGINYNYIEGSYQRVELDDSTFSVDGDGYGIAGSVALGDNWHLIGGYNGTSFDVLPGVDVDLDELTLGGGFHTSLTPNMDFVANLAYVRLEGSSQGFSIDDDGLGASIGIRAMATPSLELAAALQYIELSDGGNDTTLRGDAWYSFTPSFAVGLNVSTGDDLLRYGIGARFYFGN
jgi:outer membrane protein with beta-barrel domain